MSLKGENLTSPGEMVEFEMETRCVWEGKFPECEGIIKVETARWPKADFEKVKGRKHVSHGLCNTCKSKGRGIIIE